MAALGELFSALWSRYVTITPQALKIHELLSARGEHVTNDHIALRTFAVPGVDIEDLDRAFVTGGYEPIESYEFLEKKLDACHYEHPNPALPKVFISAIRVHELSGEARAAIAELVSQVRTGAAANPMFAASGRPWTIDMATYKLLLAESEYAAWVAAFGFRANHFTVLVNALKSFDGLQSLNAFLRESGFELNTAGGEIKGSPEQLLEQSATLADSIEIEFSDGLLSMPSCYYEFARRYPTANGDLFNGFVPTSADKIFESTDT